MKDLRRRQLAEAALAVIGKRGMSEITTADVAQAAGLSQGIVNFYFGSKEELLAEALRVMAQDYADHWTRMVAKAGPDPAAKLRAMVEADFSRNIAGRKQVTVWYAFWGEARWRPEYLRVCAELSDQYFAQTCQLCRELCESGGYRGLDIEQVARALNAMIDGLWLDLLVNPQGTDLDSAKSVCLAYLGLVFPHHFGAVGERLDAAPTPARTVR